MQQQKPSTAKNKETNNFFKKENKSDHTAPEDS